MAPTLKSLSFEVGVFLILLKYFADLKRRRLLKKITRLFFSMGHFVTDHYKGSYSTIKSGVKNLKAKLKMSNR